MNAFDDFVAGHKPALPYLPLAHTCAGKSFRAVLAKNTLSPAPCSVYTGEDLLYFFYGRPAYRTDGRGRSTSDYECFPVSMIVRPEAVTPLKRIAPFDTGAFSKGMFHDYILATTTCDEFLVTPVLDTAAKLVSAFHENSRKYLLGEPLSTLGPSPCKGVQCYHKMISNKDETAFDERRSTIEFQTESHVGLTGGNVKLVVMPAPWLDDSSVVAKLTAEWMAEIRTYFTSHSPPNEYISAIREYVYGYYRREGHLR